MGAARYSVRVDEALAFVADEFRQKTRKGTDVPYLAHLLQVMVTVAEHGGDEEQLLAALLHDYLEDITDASAEVLERRFGARVRRLVEALSDSTSQPKPPWEERKQAYLARLRTESPDVKLVSAADKLHNATSVRRDYIAVGEAVFDRFTATREQTLWYYREVVDALGVGWSHPLLDELRIEVETLLRAVGESR